MKLQKMIPVSEAVRRSHTNRPRFMRYMEHVRVKPTKVGWAAFITLDQFERVMRKLNSDPLKRGPKKTRLS